MGRPAAFHSLAWVLLAAPAILGWCCAQARAQEDEPPPRPSLLARPIDAAPRTGPAPPLLSTTPLFDIPMDPPVGFTGRSGVLPAEFQESDHFVPVEDRWRLGYPSWDRYGKGHPITDDYPYSAAGR